MNKDIHNLRGKYIKELLSKLEKANKLDNEIRKLVLDTINDYARELEELLQNKD